MKRLFRILSAAGLVMGLALAALPAGAQQPPPLKQASPAAIAAAKEILAMKHASAMYQAAVPNIVAADQGHRCCRPTSTIRRISTRSR